MDADAYLDAQIKMLPSGRAWQVSTDTLLGQLMLAFGDGAARLDARIYKLLEEADPRSTLELLSAWERVAALPDACTGQPNNINERRVALWQKLTSRGGQTIAYWQEVALRLGYRISIDEFRLADCNSGCNDALNDDRWAFAWRINVLPADEESNSSLLPTSAIATCNSDCNAYLVGYGSLDIQCIVGRAAAAHTTVLFAFPPTPEPVFWFDFTTGL